MASTAGHSAKKSQSTQKEFLIFMLIPVSVIIVVAAVLIVPSFFAKPKYDFLYSYCPSYSCAYDYETNIDGRVIQTPVNRYGDYSSTSPQIYYYSVSRNASNRIDLPNAQTYKLDSSNISPDGYKLTQNTDSGGGFLFWGDSGDNNWYLKNGLKKKELNLANNSYYSDQVTFLGWID